MTSLNASRVYKAQIYFNSFIAADSLAGLWKNHKGHGLHKTSQKGTTWSYWFLKHYVNYKDIWSTGKQILYFLNGTAWQL